MEINKDPDEIAVSGTRDSLTDPTTSNFIGEVATTEEEVHFLTGSTYKGSWDALGMTGVGRYVMPNGTIYEGEMRDGMFHGHGSLYWSENQRLDVVHHRGKLQEQKYTFSDGLTYENDDWSYCKFPDRRFFESTKKGLRPGGRTLKSAKQPTKILPAGCFDAGDGIFDPKTLCVTSYDDSNKILRTPTQKECDWIVNNCRKSWTEPTGYRPSINENWSDDLPELPYNLPMSDDSPDCWWKRLTKFEKDSENVYEEKDEPDDIEYPEISELCVCGPYVILGEPCRCLGVPMTSQIDWHGDLIDTRFYGDQSSQFHDEMENKETPFDPNRDPGTDTSSEFLFGERIVEGLEEIEASIFNISEIDESEEIPQNVSSEKMFEESRASKKNLEDEVDDELLLAAKKSKSEKNIEDEVDDEEVLSADEKSKSEMENEETKDKQHLQTDTEDFAENGILHESIVDDEESIGKSGDSMKEEKIRESSEERENAEEEEEETTQDSEIIKKLEDGKSTIIETNEDEREAEEQVKKDERSSEVSITKSSRLNSSDKSPEDQAEDRKKIKENSDENSIDERIDVDEIFPETSLENQDYVTDATIQREKVSRDREPETTDDRRTETKLLPTTTKTEFIEEAGQDLEKHRVDTDQIISDEVIAKGNLVDPEENVKSKEKIIATTAILAEEVAEDALKSGDEIVSRTQVKSKEKVKSDAKESAATPTFAEEVAEEALKDENHLVSRTSGKLKENVKSKAKTITKTAAVDEELAEEKLEDEERNVAKISEKIQENIKSESEVFTEDLVEDKLDDHAEVDKRPKDEVDEKNTTHKIEKTIAKKKSIDKSVEAFEEDKSSKKALKSQSAVENQKFFEEGSKTNVESTTKKSSMDSKNSEQLSQYLSMKKPEVVTTETTDKIVENISSGGVKVAEKKFNFLQTEEISQEKRHPSLANLSPEEKKLSKNEEIIEIFKKISKKEKPKKKCSSSNVWRLSSTLRAYSAHTKMPCHPCGLPQITNTEDLHSVAALTAPTSRPVEYSRKPCNAKIHKPTTPEVPVIALACREEYPLKIQPKPDRFPHKRSCRNIRYAKK